MSKRGERLKKIDWILFSIYLALIALGELMIYAATISDAPVNSLNVFFNTSAGNQLMWIGISLITLAIIQLIDWKFWQTFAYPIYGIGIFLLLLVLFLGVEVKGATAWFRIGSFGFQPSEVAKFATSLALASYLGSYNMDLKKRNHLLVVFGLILTPILLILMQPDAGSALIFFSFFILLYREGFSANFLLLGAAAATVLIFSIAVDDPNTVTLSLLNIGILILTALFKPRFYWVIGGIALAFSSFYFWNEASKFILLSNAIIFGVLFIVHYVNKQGKIVLVTTGGLLAGLSIVYSASYMFNNVLQSHQKERVYMWLRPDKCDPKGPLYNVIQSKLAIGSGGLDGKGLFNGTLTKLNYVPEQSTDFIFCTIGEEHGFVGSLVTIGVFLALLMRIIFLAERQRSNFSRLYAYAIAGILFLHVFINIGMTMGLVPIIGVPLPFISKGGSALLGFTIMIAVLLKLDSHRYSI